MTMRLLYWILVLLWVLSAFGAFFMPFGPYTHTAAGVGSLLELILFVLLGWKVFGQPIEG
jgi:hypothetical protein